jgi:hypothetical protein
MLQYFYKGADMNPLPKVFFLLLYILSPLLSLDAQQIPAPLKEWKAWVLDGVKDRECPINHQNGQRQCSWPTRIDIVQNGDRLSFAMRGVVYEDESMVMLPKTPKSMPTQVTIDSKKVPILAHGSLLLDAGAYTIRGELRWKNSYQYIQLPSHTAMVRLYQDDRLIDNPKIDPHAKLWIGQKQKNLQQKSRSTVSLYRKIIDGIPLKAVTYLHVSASGEPHTLLLDGVVLDGFEPTAIRSAIDATIDEDKRLRLEVRAGEWTLEVDAYTAQNLTTLKPPARSFPYANQPVWVFESDPAYRSIKIDGMRPIDPSQTNLPSHWKHLPAYLAEDSTAMQIGELYKSQQHNRKNNFTLQREMWLDFDGAGYTILDNIHATLTRPIRLETQPALHLGSVTLNNQPMLITSLQASGHLGFELREEQVKLRALSTYRDDIGQILANGWSEPFNRVRTTLHLPPGWSLLGAQGSDNKAQTWIEQWSLMDIFLLMLLAISIYRLYGIPWSLVATLFLIVLWHEADAPTTIWLIPLALIALLRLIDSMRAKKLLYGMLVLTASVILLQILNFSVQEIRTVLYPQLEKVPYSGPPISRSYTDSVMELETTAPMDDSFGSSVKRESKEMLKKYKNDFNDRLQQQQLSNRIDPNAVVQTGPGKPQWRWKRYQFNWQSGVGSEEKLELWLLSPLQNRLLGIVNIIGLLVLTLMLVSEFVKLESWKRALRVLSIVSLILFAPADLKADIPSDKLLQELKHKLTKPPACLPQCAYIERARIEANERDIEIILDISAASKIAVPLIGDQNLWLPDTVLIDGDANHLALRLDAGGKLWSVLEQGNHQIRLIGSLEGYETLTLSSKLPLNNLSIASTPTLRIKSDQKNYITFTRIREMTPEQKKKEHNHLAPLIEVERHFDFGLRWYVTTTVRLLNRIDKPVPFNYRLLAYESVLDKNIPVKEGVVSLHLQSGQRISWRSALEQVSPVLLNKASGARIMERWRIDTAPMWSTVQSGLKPIAYTKQSMLISPIFKPFEGESVTLAFEKAKAVQGENLTIESSKLAITNSQRYRDLTLSIKLNSSIAADYKLTLDAVEELKSVQIDGKPYFLKVEQGEVILPLKAKSQDVTLSWRQKSTIAPLYHFPKIDLKKPSSNNTLTLALPQNRWILWTGGPVLGPAVLFWGVLCAILIVAFFLGRIAGSPLKSRDWMLLGVGVSTTTIFAMIPIVVWIFAFRLKELYGEKVEGWRRNTMQIALVLLTLVAALTLIGIVSAGLLGTPDMMIAGNHSYAYHLNWYSDTIPATLPDPTVFSVSLWYYKALMLLWAIWISFSVIKWLKWAWGIFSSGAMWAKIDYQAKKRGNHSGS